MYILWLKEYYVLKGLFLNIQGVLFFGWQLYTLLEVELTIFGFLAKSKNLLPIPMASSIWFTMMMLQGLLCLHSKQQQRNLNYRYFNDNKQQTLAAPPLWHSWEDRPTIKSAVVRLVVRGFDSQLRPM